MSLISQIEDVAVPIVESQGAFLVEVVVRGEGRSKVVEIFADTDQGITSDMCAEISRELSRALDATDLLKGSYHLVVSSPGLDKPLRNMRQYAKNIGRVLIVKYKPDADIEKVEGELIEVSKESILLHSGKAKEARRLQLSNVLEAKVRLAW